jgi:N-acetyl-gamma-glutamyl-phosphate reductase
MRQTAIIGGSGYSGAELMRLLAGRADLRITRVTANTSAGQRVDALYPDLAGRVDLVFEEFAPDRVPDVDVAFVALPSGQGMTVVPALRKHGVRVIDLGGDFRLKAVGEYEQYYRHTHTAPGLLDEAVYGLPELYREEIARASLVANPGCYPTSAILALLPALRHGLVEPREIVVNSVSGISGAGRASSVEMSFSELNENVRAYKIGVHQHTPEIESILRAATGGDVSVSFVPHLIPITRGIYTTIHAKLAKTVSDAEVTGLYESFYRGMPFVRVKREIPQILSVVRTNYCDIRVSVQARTGHLVVLSVIDNLVKGAAGQAIQNMNLMFGLPETAGLVGTYGQSSGVSGQSVETT